LFRIFYILSFPSSLISFGKFAFYGYSKITFINFESSSDIFTFYEEIFSHLDSLITIFLPDSIYEVPKNIFNGSYTLLFVVIGIRLTQNNSNIFFGYSNFRSIKTYSSSG
jgi:hypothetical protein